LFWQPGLLGAAALILLLPVSASVILLGAHDVIRQANVATLMVGRAPEVSARGAGLGLLITALPIGLIYGLCTQAVPLEMSLIMATGINLGLALAIWRITAVALQEIE
jgi:hypothetical protein